MATRKALIAGTTGLVGGFCLQALLDAPNYAKVIALVRKPLFKPHRKLQVIQSNFDDLQNDLAGIHTHDVYCCLGSTMKKAGSREAFRKIDLSLVVKLAVLMKDQGAEQFVVITALGADKNSKVFYNRVKGETEAVLQGLGYQCLRIIRPSLLLGPREEFRPGEKAAVMLAPLLRPIFFGALKKYQPVEAEKVAHFMVKVASEQPISGVHVYESNMIV